MGVDPGIYSRALCNNVKTIHLQANRDGEQAVIRKPLREMIIEAAQHTAHQGSSTLVLALLDPK